MIFAASGITALVVTLLIRTRAFSPAEQLILRPGVESPKAVPKVLSFKELRTGARQ
jgi:hypothetical protein